jgi:hypothetical protein
VCVCVRGECKCDEHDLYDLVDYAGGQLYSQSHQSLDTAVLESHWQGVLVGKFGWHGQDYLAAPTQGHQMRRTTQRSASPIAATELTSILNVSTEHKIRQIRGDTSISGIMHRMSCSLAYKPNHGTFRCEV